MRLAYAFDRQFAVSLSGIRTLPQQIEAVYLKMLPQPTPPTPTDKVVQLSFTANRDQIYNAWNVIANLADLAGKIEVTIRAESEKGFDKSKLQNGVLEPLREIGAHRLNDGTTTPIVNE